LSVAAAESVAGGTPARRIAAAAAGSGWTTALGVLVFVIWLVPIKSYTLPVHLPFSLELYRLLLILYLFAWLVAAFVGAGRVTAAGMARPVALLAGVGFLSILTNLQSIADAGLQTQAIKSLSYFVGFLAAYLLVCSTVRSIPAIERLLASLVVGGTLVAAAALYESRSHYDLFQHLSNWVPFLKPTHGFTDTRIRGGRLRVLASAQHPIALGAALVTMVPLALYLASRAEKRSQRVLWWAAAAVCLAGAVATISRTVVLMAVAMVAAGLLLRGRRVAGKWPLLLVMVGVLHVAAPGATSHLYDAFFPKTGLASQLNARGGAAGSGRLADLGPGLQDWQKKPLFGYGIGTGKTRGSEGAGAVVDPATGVPIIFDDQYMNSLLSIGAVGLVAVVWFVWGAVRRLARAARATVGPRSDLLVACVAATAGFGAGMLTFDAFAFVQCTLVFFLVAALGLRARELSA
jgi:hypothetical protein